MAIKKLSKMLLSFLYGRGRRNRTLLWSFGDSYSTDELHPYTHKVYYNPKDLSIIYCNF